MTSHQNSAQNWSNLRTNQPKTASFANKPSLAIKTAILSGSEKRKSEEKRPKSQN